MGGPVEPPARGTFTAARKQLLRPPVLRGVVVGGIQAAAPLGFWWLDPATVYALGLVLIAAVDQRGCWCLGALRPVADRP
jgi:hypothetical protein